MEEIFNLLKVHLKCIGIDESSIIKKKNRIEITDVPYSLEYLTNKKIDKKQIAIVDRSVSSFGKYKSVVKYFNDKDTLSILRYLVLLLAEFLLAKSIEKKNEH